MTDNQQPNGHDGEKQFYETIEHLIFMADFRSWDVAGRGLAYDPPEWLERAEEWIDAFKFRKDEEYRRRVIDAVAGGMIAEPGEDEPERQCRIASYIYDAVRECEPDAETDGEFKSNKAFRNERQAENVSQQLTKMIGAAKTAAFKNSLRELFAKGVGQHFVQVLMTAAHREYIDRLVEGPVRQRRGGKAVRS